MVSSLEYENAAGRIYDIQGYAVHDGPGIRTTVYTKGCPLSCLWCHSPESQSFEFQMGYLPLKCLGVDLCENTCIKACDQGALSAGEPEEAMDGSGLIRKVRIDRSKCNECQKCAEVCINKALYTAGWDTDVDEVYERLMKDVPFFKNGGGVTISGGEAMSQFPFTYNLAKRLKDSGIHICLDTTGFANTEQFRQIIPYVDLFLYDLKQMDSDMHKKLAGVPNEKILENARFIAANGGKLQVRYPVIPRLNDSEENMHATAKFCKELGDAVTLVQLLPYHHLGTSKYERLGRKYKMHRWSPPSEEFMQKALDIFKSYDLPCQLH